MVTEDREGIFDGVVYNVLDLQFVLMIGVSVGQLAELLCQIETMGHILWGYEIAGNFDTTVQIADLMGSTGRDEDGIA